MEVVNLPNYSNSHHNGDRFTNEPGSPVCKAPTEGVWSEAIKFAYKKADYVVEMQTRDMKKDLSDCDVSCDDVKIWWVNHATILMKFGDKFIITDPQFYRNASPIPFHIRRTAQPPCQISDIPYINYVVVSHDHWDHLNYSSLEQIKEKNPDVIIIAPLMTSNLIESWGFKTVSVDWRQKVIIGDIIITCFPARHHTARYGNDANKRLWASFLFTYKNEINYYFPGDTAIGPHFREVYEYVGKEIDLVSIPIGPQEPSLIMRPVHLNPIDACTMSKELHAKVAFPMHFGTFPLGISPARHDLDVLVDNWDSVDLFILKNGGLMVLNDEKRFVPVSEDCKFDMSRK